MSLPSASPGGGVVSPWQRLYGSVHRLRWRWWRRRARRLPRPVVSVGNLHWGGTGKTPLVAAVARHLQRRGRRPAILSRGYRRSTRGALLVSRGEGPVLDPWQAGEEPFLLAIELPGVAVAVGESRWAAGELALAALEPPPDLFLLDDGFSHLALERDVDLLVLPAIDPLGGGRLPPSGRLREPLEAVARAHAALLTGAEAGFGEPWVVQELLARQGFAGPVFAAPTRVTGLLGEDGERVEASLPMLLVTGIAHPERVLASAGTAGARLAGHLRFADHHDYPPRSLRAIERRCRSLGAQVVLATTKDAVKLRGRLQVPLVRLAVAAEPEKAFWDWLDARLEELT